jgi:hypothetical protein
VRPADLRAESNASFDFINPALPFNTQDPIHPTQIPGHFGAFRAAGRAMGLSATGGNAAQWKYSDVGVTDYALDCTFTVVRLLSPATSSTLPACPTGKIFFVGNGQAVASTASSIPVKSTAGTTLVTLTNGEWAGFVAGNASGSWSVFSTSSAILPFANHVQQFGAATTGTFNIDARFLEVYTSGTTLSFSTLATNPAPQGTWMYLKNIHATNFAPITGASGGDLPVGLAPGQGLVIFTTGANVWYKVGQSGPPNGTVTLVAGTATVTSAAVLATSNIVLSHQNCNSCGVAYVGTIVAGTSFVVNSSNGADTSKIYWEIR